MPITCETFPMSASFRNSFGSLPHVTTMVSAGKNSSFPSVSTTRTGPGLSWVISGVCRG